jgi:ferredoxin
MRAIVDENICTGCGLRGDICPEVFAMGGSTAKIIVAEIQAGSEDSCRKVADECPVNAIFIKAPETTRRR